MPAQSRPRVHVAPTEPDTTERCFSNIALSSKNGNGGEKAGDGGGGGGGGGGNGVVVEEVMKRNEEGDITYIENGRGGEEPEVALETHGTLEQEGVQNAGMDEISESEDSRHPVF